MPQPRRFILKPPPIGERRCPGCGLPMFLSSIEPTDKPGEEWREFECADCAYAERATVKFRDT